LTLSYLGRRLIATALSLLGAVTILFAMIHLVPGDPVAAILGDSYTESAAANIRKQLGLDRPLLVQYGAFIGGLLRGDIGKSFINRQPVFREVLGNFRYTLQLGLFGLMISVVVGITLGLIAALNRGKAADIAAMAAAVLGVSMPSFWLGILLMILFAVKLGWLPLIGVGQAGDPVDSLRHLILPGVALGMRGAGLVARVTRSSVLETVTADYVRTAKSKGASKWSVVMVHSVHNALLPMVTIAGLDLGRMRGGTTVVETVFSRPGTGVLLIQAVLTRDYPLIQATFAFFLLVIIMVNFLVDLAYARLDPRVAYG